MTTIGLTHKIPDSPAELGCLNEPHTFQLHHRHEARVHRYGYGQLLSALRYSDWPAA